jgi:hypothetical protein
MKITTIVFTFLMLTAHSSSAEAQTSDALVKRDVNANYEVLKTIIKSHSPTSLERRKMLDWESHQQVEGLDLFYCSDFTDLGLPVHATKTKSSQLSEIAYDAVMYENGLSRSGYPRSEWGDMVASREARALSRGRLDVWSEASKAELKRWASKLNEYRRQNGGNLPKVLVQGGCGAGGTTTAFRTEPPGGRVLLIPEIYYEFCRKQGIDPGDEFKCEYWDEVHQGQQVEVSGSYEAKLVWGNHSLIRKYSASRLLEGNNYVTLK